MDDVLIIGGGPAGLAAALPVARLRQTVRLLDSGEYRNAAATHIHNVSTHDGTPPAVYRAAARAELLAYPTVAIEDAAVTAVTRTEDGGGVIATLADGTTRAARALVLATGVVDELPPLPGLAALWGTHIFHCPFCHGYEVRDTPLAVAAGPHALRGVQMVRHLSPDLMVVTLDPAATVPDDDRDALARLGIPMNEEPVVAVAAAGPDAMTLTLASGATLRRRGMFIAAHLRQRALFAADLGCELSEAGGVYVDAMQATSVPGVWAAGDMAHPRHLPMGMQTVPMASSGGLVAGFATIAVGLARV